MGQYTITAVVFFRTVNILVHNINNKGSVVWDFYYQLTMFFSNQAHWHTADVVKKISFSMIIDM